MDSSSTRNWRSSTFLWGQFIKIQIKLKENSFKLIFQWKSELQWHHSDCPSKLPETTRWNLSQEASERRKDTVFKTTTDKGRHRSSCSSIKKVFCCIFWQVKKKTFKSSLVLSFFHPSAHPQKRWPKWTVWSHILYVLPFTWATVRKFGHIQDTHGPSRSAHGQLASKL